MVELMRDFTTEDFSGAGQYLVRIGAEETEKRKNNNFANVERTGYLTTITYKVGYLLNNEGIAGSHKQITCLIAMSDGSTKLGEIVKDNEDKYVLKTWITDEQSSSKEKFVRYLNNSKDEYRFATQEEVVRLVMHQSGRWRNG